MSIIKKNIYTMARMKSFPPTLVIAIILATGWLCPRSVYAQHYTPDSVKIITYNVMNGMSRDTSAGKSGFCGWLKSQDPAIVGFQELNGFSREKLEALGAAYGNPYAILMERGTYKVGLTSRYPIVDAEVVRDHMTHGFIIARIRDYHVVVAHLAPNSYKKRRLEIALILRTIRTRDPHLKDKWILMGDLNSLSPLDKAFYAVDDRKRQRTMEAKKKHPHNERLIHGTQIDYQVQRHILGGGFTDCFHQFAGNILRSSETTGRVDYIYVSGALKPALLSAHFIRDAFTRTRSDHVPMCIVLKN